MSPLKLPGRNPRFDAERNEWKDVLDKLRQFDKQISGGKPVDLAALEALMNSLKDKFVFPLAFSLVDEEGKNLFWDLMTCMCGVFSGARLVPQAAAEYASGQGPFAGAWRGFLHFVAACALRKQLSQVLVEPVALTTPRGSAKSTPRPVADHMGLCRLVGALLEGLDGAEAWTRLDTLRLLSYVVYDNAAIIRRHHQALLTMSLPLARTGVFPAEAGSEGAALVSSSDKQPEWFQLQRVAINCIGNLCIKRCARMRARIHTSTMHTHSRALHARACAVMGSWTPGRARLATCCCTCSRCTPLDGCHPLLYSAHP